MSQTLKIHHELADVIVMPSHKINRDRLQSVILTTLDHYLHESPIPAETVHEAARQRHGTSYRTAGYYLRLYRQRADLTQAALAERAALRQHHVSEMESNKRVIGKVNARKLAAILDCDYRKLLNL